MKGVYFMNNPCSGMVFSLTGLCDASIDHGQLRPPRPRTVCWGASPASGAKTAGRVSINGLTVRHIIREGPAALMLLLPASLAIILAPGGMMAAALRHWQRGRVSDEHY